MSNKISVGDTVLTTVDARTNNGASIAPMIVTNVNEIDGEGTFLNGHIFLDTGQRIRGQNIPLVDSEPDEIEEKAPTKVAFSK